MIDKAHMDSIMEFIGDIMKDTYIGSSYNRPIIGNVMFEKDDDQEDTSCKHVWKSYIGLKESFDYCIKCDEKKENDGDI